MTWEIRQGDALALLRAMPEASVQCVVTSPPYWGLRDYGTATWDGGDSACAHKGRPKPQRDTSGGGPEKGRFAETRGTQPAKAQHTIPVRGACRCGAVRIDAQLGLESTPDGYVAALVEVFAEVRRVLRKDGTLWLNIGDSYCANPPGNARPDHSGPRLTGTRGEQGSTRAREVRAKRDFGARLKTKDLVGLSDGVTVVVVASRGREAVPVRLPRMKAGKQAAAAAAAAAAAGASSGRRMAGFNERWDAAESRGDDFAGANKRTVWTIGTRPFLEAHFATFPEALVEPCVLAGSRPGDTVLDPFAGSGTVGVVALRHGRRFLGLELNPVYVEMARRRIAGPLFAGQAEEAR